MSDRKREDRSFSRNSVFRKYIETWVPLINRVLNQPRTRGKKSGVNYTFLKCVGNDQCQGCADALKNRDDGESKDLSSDSSSSLYCGLYYYRFSVKKPKIRIAKTTRAIKKLYLFWYNKVPSRNKERTRVYRNDFRSSSFEKAIYYKEKEKKNDNNK